MNWSYRSPRNGLGIKAGNELEAHRAGLVTEVERRLEYHDSALENLIAALQKIPTKAIAEATAYNPRTLRWLKHREFRPSQGQRQALLPVINSCP